MSMILGVDIRVLVLGRRTGIEEYLLNLLPRLIKQRPDITFRLFYNAWRKQPLVYGWLGEKNVELYASSIPNRLLFAAQAFFGMPRIDKRIGGCDVFWSPHILNVALSPRVRHIITVHDLAFEHYPEFFSREKLWWHTHLMVPRTQLKKAHRILAVSQSTKKDLTRLYRISENKIEVICPGVDGEFRPLEESHQDIAAARKKYGLPEKFILFFGTIEPRKNVTGLIKAFEIFRANDTLKAISYKLVIAGTKGWLCGEIFESAKRSPLASDIIFTGFIAPEDKPALYNAADVFVYPSFFEGFGFPPLEAMACGTPVITSNRSSLPEVAGDAALLVDPYRSDEMADAFLTLLQDKEAGAALVKRGLERAKRFSWDACAEKTLSVLTDKS